MRLNLRLYPGATEADDGVLRAADKPFLDGLLYPGATSSTNGVLRFQILVPAPAESASEASPIEVAFIDSTATVYGPSVGAAVAAAAIGSGATVPAPGVAARIAAAFIGSSSEVYGPDVGAEATPAPPPTVVVAGGSGASRGRPGRLRRTVEDARVDWNDEAEVLLLALAAVADED